MKLSRFLMTTCALLALAAVTPSSFAAGEDCQFNLSQPVLDYGLMNRAIRPDAGPERHLGERRLSLNLNCATPTDMSLFYRAMAATTQRYRFADRGTYQIRIHDAVLDGQAVELGLIGGVGQAPSQAESQLIWRPAHGVVPLRAGVPTQGRTFSAQLELTAWVEEHGMQVRDAVTWQASGVFDAVGTGLSRETTLHARFAPAACEPALSNGGVIDFGNLTINDLNATKITHLPPRSLLLRVGCEAPTAFALVMHDNRAGSATVNGEHFYGLGTDGRSNGIGFYSVNIDPANSSADSFARLYAIDSSSNGAGWNNASLNPIPLAKNTYLSFTDNAGRHTGPSMIQNLSTRVTVDAVIAPTHNLDLSNAIDLDGAGTIEIIYL